MPHTSQKLAWYPIPQPNSNEKFKNTQYLDHACMKKL